MSKKKHDSNNTLFESNNINTLHFEEDDVALINPP